MNLVSNYKYMYQLLSKASFAIRPNSSKNSVKIKSVFTAWERCVCLPHQRGGGGTFKRCCHTGVSKVVSVHISSSSPLTRFDTQNVTAVKGSVAEQAYSIIGLMRPRYALSLLV